MKCVLLRRAHHARPDVSSPLRRPASESHPRGHQRSMILKLLICLLLALQEISYADPKYNDHTSSKVSSWLLRAESALANGQLISPPKGNALAYLERVFAEDPANTKAASVLDKLIARFVASNYAIHAPQELARMRILEAVSTMARSNGTLAHHAGKAGMLIASELRDCHVSLGLAALQLGDPAEAGRQQKAAANLVAQYQLDKGGLRYLSQLVEQIKAPRRSYDKTASESRRKAPRISQGKAPQASSSPRPTYRAFGTF
jgi:hypothetical protein